MKIRICYPRSPFKWIRFWYLDPWLAKHDSCYQVRDRHGRMHCTRGWWWKYHLFPCLRYTRHLDLLLFYLFIAVAILIWVVANLAIELYYLEYQSFYFVMA